MSVESEKTEEAPGSELSDLCELLTSFIGPDEHAMLRFHVKESQKFAQIGRRLGEILGHLEEISIEPFGNPHELTVRIKNVLASVDAIHDFVSDVKKRLQQMEKEIGKRKPNKLLKFFRAKQEPVVPVSLQGLLYETDDLMRKHNLVPDPQTKEEPKEEAKEGDNK